jgi:hypothetical protein
MQAAGLEELAHLVAADQAVQLAADDGGLVRPRAHQGLGALADAHAGEELGLGEDRGGRALALGGAMTAGKSA